MNEKLKNKLTERFDKITAGECDNKDLRDALLKAYLAGGEHGYQYAVDKAMKVLRDDTFVSGDIIELFKRAMEEWL